MGRLSIERHIGKTFGQLEVIGVTEKIKTHRKLICRCSCGNTKEILSHSVVSGSTLSCGCLISSGYTSLDKYIGQRFNRLVVTGITDRIYTKKSVYRKVICKCDCGNTSEVRTGDLLSGKLFSCGCKRDENSAQIRNCLLGKKFGKLTAIDRIQNNKNYYCILYKLECECGRTTKVSSSNLVKKNGQKSCGKCGLFRNGVKTSQIALDLHVLIGIGEHNHYTGVLLNGRDINVDIGIPEEKIAIEYDGSYWHNNSEERDKAKTKVLVDNGWGVLRVKSTVGLPTKKELNILLKQLKTRPQAIIIHM